MSKKLIYTFFAVQAVLILAVAALLVIDILNYRELKTPTNTATEASLLNSMSARLGQVQSDLYQIKAKIGAIAPTAQ